MFSEGLRSETPEVKNPVQSTGILAFSRKGLEGEVKGLGVYWDGTFHGCPKW